VNAWFIREDSALRPFGRESATLFDKVPQGKPVFVEVRQPRNAKHHRLYWTMCARIAEAVGCEGEDISHILKIRTGHVKEVKTKRGIEEIPLSISFKDMDQEKFRNFFDKCLYVIEHEIGVARPDILAEMKDLIEPQEAA
jgi:hypothetical protein